MRIAALTFVLLTGITGASWAGDAEPTAAGTHAGHGKHHRHRHLSHDEALGKRGTHAHAALNADEKTYDKNGDGVLDADERAAYKNAHREHDAGATGADAGGSDHKPAKHKKHHHG